MWHILELNGGERIKTEKAKGKRTDEEGEGKFVQCYSLEAEYT